MKDISTIIKTFEDAVIQIATPYSTGSGFYLKNHDIIITNEHVVRDNKKVIISGAHVDKQIVDVLYIDQYYDIAFLSPPPSHNMPSVELINEKFIPTKGEEIIAIGHPFGLKYTTTRGYISTVKNIMDDIEFIQHDAALNPANSGGPLISTRGQIVGINTFIIKNGTSIGFSLPSTYLHKTIKEFKSGNGQQASRCVSCKVLVFDNDNQSKYCLHCGAEITLLSSVEDYSPTGINSVLEEIIGEMGHNIVLSRIGPSNWRFKEGSATINITYHEKTGLITGDAYLGTLPEQNIIDIYQYLLHQNYHLEGLTFSVKDDDIILSLLIYDQYLHKDIAKGMFINLSKTADHHDNILVEKYGAKW